MPLSHICYALLSYMSFLFQMSFLFHLSFLFQMSFLDFPVSALQSSSNFIFILGFYFYFYFGMDAYQLIRFNQILTTGFERGQGFLNRLSGVGVALERWVGVLSVYII